MHREGEECFGVGARKRASVVCVTLLREPRGVGLGRALTARGLEVREASCALHAMALVMLESVRRRRGVVLVVDEGAGPESDRLLTCAARFAPRAVRRVLDAAHRLSEPIGPAGGGGVSRGGGVGPPIGGAGAAGRATVDAAELALIRTLLAEGAP